ncbi:MAG: TetR/AcrR family transcriptional regulator [Actinomycetota bacterium]|nr:TetR/AcrR family transcriptional regulator [Actinomycetota bacterium]
MAGEVGDGTVVGRRPRTTARGAATREAVLDAALACFSAVGYEHTSIADIRARSGVSTGSIYHHFGSKEDVAAALYLRGVASTQAAGVAALDGATTGPEMVTALVESYLDWVATHPDEARFLLGMRHAPFMDAAEADLARANATVDERTAARYAARIEAGDLPADLSLLRAVVFGPCRHWAGQWLAGRTELPLADAKGLLAAAARAAVADLVRAAAG